MVANDSGSWTWPSFWHIWVVFGLRVLTLALLNNGSKIFFIVVNFIHGHAIITQVGEESNDNDHICQQHECISAKESATPTQRLGLVMANHVQIQ